MPSLQETCTATTPPLVEVGNAFGNTPIPIITNPVQVTLPVSSAALTASDDPVEAVQVQLVHRTEKRFGADEADRSRDFS
jgi:hypothetical protein